MDYLVSVLKLGPLPLAFKVVVSAPSTTADSPLASADVEWVDP
jgi:hypothetical protein